MTVRDVATQSPFGPSGLPALVAVTHGSRDPRSAATVRALVDLVRAGTPHVDVRTAFLDLSDPPIADVLADLHGEGHRHVVVVPLLLGDAYHARVDLPGIVDRVTARLPQLRVTVSHVLGTDPALCELALRRVRETGEDLDDPRLGVVLAAVGSSHTHANAAVERIAEDWQARHGFLAAPAFASVAQPDVPAALAALRARGGQRFVVASWFLAPGLLPDRVRDAAHAAAPGTSVAAPLGAEPVLAEVVLRRYADALATLPSLRSA